ncbi:unnamed protein product [Rhodiola kirilowii]
MLGSNHQANQPEERNGDNSDSLFSPGFKSVVAMAGWDEEAILIASLVVEDTPERELKQKKRPEIGLKTPPNSSRRKRRNHRRGSPIKATMLNLDEEDKVEKKQESVEEKTVIKIGENGEKLAKKIEEASGRISEASSSSKAGIPCMDRLREELSCAICLEICYEPSTTSCGHSFCRKCLSSAADKCGKKCPKCRQLIGNGRSCTVNTVLWNTIQLLFPQEIESRKRAAEGSMKSPESGKRHSSRVKDHHGQSPSFRAIRVSSARSPTFRPIRVADRSMGGSVRARSVAEDVGGGRRREVAARPSQAEDAALALRLQREEFMEAFRGENETSVGMARANLRAMASRAMTLRVSRARH